MATNERFAGSGARPLPVPEGTLSNDPVKVGVFRGVALTDRAEDGTASVALEGAFRLQVGTTTELAPGDLVYVTEDGELTPEASGNEVFGAALEAKGDEPAAIAVELGVTGAGASSGSAGGTAAWFEANGTGTTSGAPFQVTLAELEDLPNMPLQPDLYDVEDTPGKVTILQDGLYALALVLRPRQGNDPTGVTADGLASVQASIRVNGGSVAPAYYPSAQALIWLAAAGGTQIASSMLAFDQNLAVGDVVDVSAKANLVTAEGSQPLEWSMGDSYFTIRRIA